MAVRPGRWLERKSRERSLRQWAEMAEDVEHLPRRSFRKLADEAHALRASLNRFLMRGDSRAMLSRAALDGLELPGGTDWRWRPGFLAGPIAPRGVVGPDSGTRLGDRATLWHDCSERAIVLEQVQNPDATELSPHALRLEVFSFHGSFLSLAIDLPSDVLEHLSRSHILRLDLALLTEQPMSVFARLNVQHGPNVDELLQHLGGLSPGERVSQVIEFDLAYVDLNERRLEKIWLDLIFEAPRMSAIEIRELYMSRHLRADF